jgi:AcrR family transcriptional regulator
MQEKCTRPEEKIRARSAEEKARVREAIIAAGRELFRREAPDQVSLRRIAAAAGYTPAAIYRYFKDQQELFAYIRERDMEDAVDHLCHLIARKRDPRQRVLTLFIGTADYWLEHMEEFLVLFPPGSMPYAIDVSTDGAQAFGRSAIVQRLLALYYDAVAVLFESLQRPPLSHKLAADMLLAAVHGSLIFPQMTPSVQWSDRRSMIQKLVTTIVGQWVLAAQPKG